MTTHVFDLLDGKVGVGRHADFLWLDIDDDEERVGRVALEELVDLEVRGAQLGASVVPADELLSRIDLFEHVVHRLDVVVI